MRVKICTVRDGTITLDNVYQVYYDQMSAFINGSKTDSGNLFIFVDDTDGMVKYKIPLIEIKGFEICS